MIFIPFQKHYKSPDQIVDLLLCRGLIVDSRPVAIHKLKHIGYYRFSAYLYPFVSAPKENQIFKQSVSFKDALSLYDFDSELRHLLFYEIAEIEVAVRSVMANIIANESGNIFWVTSPNMFVNKKHFQKTMSIIDQEMKHSKEDFIKHFKHKYSNPYPPAWMLFEILPLGTINYIYNNISSNVLRKKIAKHFSLTIPVFSSWLTIITLTRNACGHHSRVWNKENAIIPAEPRRLKRPWISPIIPKNRIFYNICIIKYLVDIISPNNDIKEQLCSLLLKYPNVDIAAMGFPKEWKNEPIWEL